MIIKLIKNNEIIIQTVEKLNIMKTKEKEISLYRRITGNSTKRSDYFKEGKEDA